MQFFFASSVVKRTHHATFPITLKAPWEKGACLRSPTCRRKDFLSELFPAPSEEAAWLAALHEV